MKRLTGFNFVNCIKCKQKKRPPISYISAVTPVKQDKLSKGKKIMLVAIVSLQISQLYPFTIFRVV
ncbi:hypothetical protein KP715_00820 [Staphylococcus aureus]|nr:hypothetical protein KP715_00820 [Staphylococcus aureus]